MVITRIEMTQIISAYSKKIQEYIAESDWNGLSGQLTLRQQALEDFFSSQVLTDSTSFAREMVKKIRLEDDNFQQMIIDQKHGLEKQHQSLRQGRKAVKVYQEL